MMHSSGQPPADLDPDSRELASMTELQRVARSAFDVEPGPSPRVRAAVLQRIRLVDSPPRVLWLQRFAAWLRAPRKPRWASAAAVLLIVIEGALLVRTPPGREPASAMVTTRALATAVARLRVEFNPLASAAQIRDLLDSPGARIVDGPTPTGGYVIELAAADPRILSENLGAARARRDVLLTLQVVRP